jgi:hypothetical protein
MSECRSRHVGIFLLACLSLGVARPAAADEVNPAPGTRVRVTTARKRVVGRVLAVRDDLLLLERDGKRDPLKIRRPDVLRVEVSERRSARGRGASIGFLVGLGGAIALGVLAGESCPAPPDHNGWDTFAETLNSNLCFGRAETALLAGIVTVPLGTLLGAAVAHGERWRPLNASRVSFAVGPVRGGGAGVRLAIAF